MTHGPRRGRGEGRGGQHCDALTSLGVSHGGIAYRTEIGRAGAPREGLGGTVAGLMVPLRGIAREGGLSQIDGERRDIGLEGGVCDGFDIGEFRRISLEFPAPVALLSTGGVHVDRAVKHTRIGHRAKA